MDKVNERPTSGGIPLAAERVPGPTLYSRLMRRPLSNVRVAKAQPDQTRARNRAAVLQCLYHGEGLSRADVARAIGLTRVTISDVIAELIEDDLVVELGTRTDSRPGKPATLVDINRTGLSVIGLDLSGPDSFRGAVTDLDGTILADHTVPLEGRTGDAAVHCAVEVIDALLALAPVPVLGIGVASPGIVDSRGAVLVATNLDWSHVPLRALLARHTGVPVQVGNDANVAALGERFFGEVVGDIMLVKIGSGVGAGLVISGQQVIGSRSAAGEIGHVVVDPDKGGPCTCGKRGCVETWVSIPSLRAALDAADTPQQRMQVRAAAGRSLGLVSAPIVAALNLSSIVIAGPEEELDATFMDAVHSAIHEHTLDLFRGDVTLSRSTLGEDGIVLGSVAMVLAAEVGVT